MTVKPATTQLTAIQLSAEVLDQNGEPDGPHHTWYDNGQMEEESHYQVSHYQGGDPT